MYSLTNYLNAANGNVFVLNTYFQGHSKVGHRTGLFIKYLFY